MRRPFLGLAAALFVLAVMPSGRAFAQYSGDPFSLYYGYYLPHAAAIAAQPSPLDSINQMTMRRQQSAQTDRSTLYDPISPYGDGESDTLSPYSRGRATDRRIQPHVFDYSPSAPVARGYGSSMYFNRTARYHPTLKVGRGPNRNVATARYSRMPGGGGGGGGMGGGSGMPSMPSAPSVGPR